MCFSMLASVAAGTALTVAGVGTVKLARRRAELPLALLPLLFGAQQLVEGAVWWSLDHPEAGLNAAATFAYLLFARVLWPVLVPLAILGLEPVCRRRKAMVALVALGAGVALEGAAAVLRGPSTSHVAGASIAYAMPSLLVIAVYLAATCGAALLSSHLPLRLIGAGALGLALLTLWLYAAVFVSVWCFFSAILTGMIFVYLGSRRRSSRLVGVDAGGSPLS